MEESQRYHRVLLHVENNGSLRGSTASEISRAGEQTQTSLYSELVRLALPVSILHLFVCPLLPLQ